jgi:hypothetical protein
MDINAPRYWWQEFDTYRTGMTKQSQSTMHTILKRPLEQSDFNIDIPFYLLVVLNKFIIEQEFHVLKNLMPEGFLQRRVVCTNYKTLRNIVKQRKDHRLPEWNTVFMNCLKLELSYPEWLFDE